MSRGGMRSCGNGRFSCSPPALLFSFCVWCFCTSWAGGAEGRNVGLVGLGQGRHEPQLHQQGGNSFHSSSLQGLAQGAWGHSNRNLLSSLARENDAGEEKRLGVKASRGWVRLLRRQLDEGTGGGGEGGGGGGGDKHGDEGDGTKLEDGGSLSDSTEEERVELAKVAKKVATEEGHIIAAITTKGLLHFLQNWVAFIAALGYEKNILIFTHDKESYEFVEEHWPGQAVMLHFGSLKSAEDAVAAEKTVIHSRSHAFFHLSTYRPHFLRTLVELGYSVLYSDTDVVWLKDPFPFFQSLDDARGGRPRLDVFVTAEERAPDRSAEWKTTQPLTDYDPPPAKLCSCVLFVRAGDAGSVLLGRWFRRMRDAEWKEEESDQTHLDAVVKEMREKGEAGNIGILPQQLFAPGWLAQKWLKAPEDGDDETAKRALSSAVSLHFNFLELKYERQMLMKKLNMWKAPIGTPPHDLTEISVFIDDSGRVVAFDTFGIAKKARAVSKDSTVVVVIVEEDDIVHFRPWAKLVEKANLADRLVVLTNDELAFQAVTEQCHGHALLLRAVPLSVRNDGANALALAEAAVVRMWPLLPQALYAILQTGINIFYSSVKAFWLKSPFDVAHSTTYDVLFGSLLDSDWSIFADKSETFPLDARHLSHASPHWMYVRSTDGGAELLREWYLSLTLPSSALTSSGEEEGGAFRPYTLTYDKAFGRALVRCRIATFGSLPPKDVPPRGLVAKDAAALIPSKGQIVVLDMTDISDEKGVKGVMEKLHVEGWKT